jgi:hypothetical protein
VIAIEGSTTTLTCPLQGSSFQWQKLNHSYWFILEQGAKYGNVNTEYLAINNVDQHDGGTYSCKADDIQPLLMTIVFRGTKSKLEKAQSNEANKCICIKMKPGTNFRKNEILIVILCMLVSDLSVMCNFTQCSTHAI